VTDCGHVSVCLSVFLSVTFDIAASRRRPGNVVLTSCRRPGDVLATYSHVVATSWRRRSQVVRQKTVEARRRKNRRVGDGGEPSTFSAVDGREKHLARSTEIDIRRPPADSNAPFTHTRRVAARCFAALLKTLRVFH